MKAVFADFQLVWLGINAFLFVHFYMAFLVEKWFYTRVLLGVSPPFHTRESYYIYLKNVVGATELRGNLNKSHRM